MDLTGIANENEFYTHHYLSAILEGDLKEVFAGWKRREQEEGVRPPYAELRALARPFHEMRRDLERLKRPEARLERQREFAARLLTALGYPFAPQVKALDDGASLPVLAEIPRKSGAPELWVLEALDLSNEGVDPLTLEIHPCQYPPPPDSGPRTADPGPTKTPDSGLRTQTSNKSSRNRCSASPSRPAGCCW